MIRCCLLIVLLLAAHPLGAAEVREPERPPSGPAIALPTQWSTYYVVLLKKGPSSGNEPSAESSQTLMNEHIQYQLRLQQSGQALAGGGFKPLGDDVVGMTLLRAESLAEAERLARADPAVAAGRFSAVVYEWYVPAGRFSE